MKIFDKIRGKIEDLNSEEIKEDEYMDEKELELPPLSATRLNNVVDLHAAASSKTSRMKVVVIEPRSFDDVQQVANCLKEKKPVIINFEHTVEEDAKRIIDFVSGTTYALSGNIKKVGRTVFLCAPSNVNVACTQDSSGGDADLPWMKK